MHAAQASSIPRLNSPLMPPMMAGEAIGGPAPVLCLLRCLLSVMSVSGRMRMCDRWMIESTVGRSPDMQLVHRTALLDKRSPRRADTSESPSSGREPRKTSMSHQFIYAQCRYWSIQVTVSRTRHVVQVIPKSKTCGPEGCGPPELVCSLQGCSHLPPHKGFVVACADSVQAWRHVPRPRKAGPPCGSSRARCCSGFPRCTFRNAAAPFG